MEDTTQEVVETTTPAEGQVETTETQGVEQEVNTAPAQTLEGQSEEQLDAAAEESLWATLRAKKGWASEEDAAKAYAELEKSFSRKAQDYATLEKLTNAILEDDGDAPYTSEVDKEVKELKADRDIRIVSEKYSDFSDHVDEMSKILKETPNASVVFSGPKGVELLYKMAKVSSQDQVIEKAREEGKQEVTAKEIEKTLGSVAAVTKAKTPAPSVFTRQQISEMSLEEYTQNEAEIKAQMNAGLIK